jgi:uncharacterized protein (TIGR02147 family)
MQQYRFPAGNVFYPEAIAPRPGIDYTIHMDARLPWVFEYTDYRSYLSDYYKAHKGTSDVFSYQYLAHKAGFRNKGFVYNVISGTKNLSLSSAARLASVVTSTQREADYFVALVAFNQARSPREREVQFRRLSEVQCDRGNGARIREVRRDQYEFYAEWYHTAIWSLIGEYQFKGDFAWLAAKLHPRISVRQARRSVELLQRLGLVRATDDGSYETVDPLLRPDPKIASVAVHALHCATADLAREAIDELPVNERDITGRTFGSIEELSWDMGNTGVFMPADGNDSVTTCAVAPSNIAGEQLTSACILKALDNGGNMAHDTAFILVVRDPSSLKVSDTTVSINDDYHVRYAATDRFGHVVRYTIDIDGDGVNDERRSEAGTVDGRAGAEENDRFVFLVDSGRAYPHYRDSLVIKRENGTYKSELHLNILDAPQVCNQLSLDGAVLSGRNDSAPYDCRFDIGEGAQLIEYYRFDHKGYWEGPNYWSTK